MKVILIGDEGLKAELAALLKIDVVENLDFHKGFIVHIHTPESLTKLATAKIFTNVSHSNSMRNGIAPPVSLIAVLVGFEDYHDDDEIIDFLHEFTVTHATTVQEAADFLNKFYVEPPAYSPYTVECLIERDGPTEMYLEGAKYVFQKNAFGHYICEVQRDDHRKYLCSLGTFRVYLSDKIPPPEFTDDETDFIREWRTMDKDSFRAYVNARFDRFAGASDKIKAMAANKWNALHANDEAPQGCPILLPALKPQEDPEPKGKVIEQIGPPTMLDESDEWNEEQWAEWVNTWTRLSGEFFERFVIDNELKILNAPEEIWEKAQAKWEKLIPDKPWPYVGGDGE